MNVFAMLGRVVGRVCSLFWRRLEEDGKVYRSFLFPPGPSYLDALRYDAECWARDDDRLGPPPRSVFPTSTKDGRPAPMPTLYPEPKVGKKVYR